MKKQKHKQRPKPKRRNAAVGQVTAPPPKKRRNAAPRGANREGLRTLAASVAGSFASALVAGAAVEAGVKPQTAAVVTLLGGAASAYGMKGLGRAAGVGAACMASGQLALAWQVKRQADAKARAEQKKLDEKTAAPAPAAAQVATGSAPALAGGAPKRNGYDDEDDGRDDPRNAGEVEDYAYDDGYAQVA